MCQRVGAGDLTDARRLGWHALQIGTATSALLALAVYLGREGVVALYTADAAVAVAAFVLRAWRVATVPVVIYAGTLWGVGLGGGYALAFNVGGAMPVALQGAPGFWAAATAALVLASVGLTGFKAWVLSRPRP